MAHRMADKLHMTRTMKTKFIRNRSISQNYANENAARFCWSIAIFRLNRHNVSAANRKSYAIALRFSVFGTHKINRFAATIDSSYDYLGTGRHSIDERVWARMNWRRRFVSRNQSSRTNFRLWLRRAHVASSSIAIMQVEIAIAWIVVYLHSKL